MERTCKFLGWLLPGVLILGACTRQGPDEDALLRYARAEAIYAQGHFPQVISLLAGEKSFPPALALRGKAEYFSGKQEAAEKSFRRALSQRPSSVEAALYLARILRERGEAGEAEAMVEGILGDDPGDIRALRLRAELYRDRGPPGEEAAAALLDRAVEASAETALVAVSGMAVNASVLIADELRRLPKLTSPPTRLSPGLYRALRRSLPVLFATTGTTVAAAAPFLLLPGGANSLIRSLSTVSVLGVGISALCALTLLPALRSVFPNLLPPTPMGNGKLRIEN